MRRLRKKVFEIVEASPDKKGSSWYFDLFLISLISLNVLAIILESVKSIRVEYDSFFTNFELFSVTFFSVEYLVRVWSCVEDKDYDGSFRGRLKFIFSPMAIIDLLAILPFYLVMFTIDLRLLRILRLLRLFRLFKVVRYLSALKAIREVFKDKKEQLILSIIFIFFMLLIVSSLMYYIENEAQPDVFSSIPATMWWGVATLTTVGYGDVYPITPQGQVLGGIIAILGIGLFALPTGILASGFSDALDSAKEEKEKNKEKEKVNALTGKKTESINFCPNCGVDLTKHL